jgi:superoxide dismutase
VFGDELIIGGVRAQAKRLEYILDQIEADEHWKDHSSYYVKEIFDVEKSLRRIRKIDLEPINRFS